ncbi:MAG: pyridoxal phosphate-dependent aminotransferase [Bacteroidales bacterium]|nr:pyridoxal phosphate-dependent aminotransferase [Bacteroidales bacterium]
MNFDKIVERRGTNCVKWDAVPEGVLPMWVADMDFETAPCVQEAVRKRAGHGVFGYTSVPASYYESVCNWFASRHGWRPDPSWIIYCPGIVPALSACVSAFTMPGDKVIIMSPVYNCFFSSIRNYGCTALDVPLITVDEGGMPRYEIDFDALERAAGDPAAKLMLICSPHNPAGRVWSREELERVGRICIDNGVVPVSDEIHCEFTMPGVKFVPFASVSPEFEKACVTLNSPSKAFNIAGLQISNIICADPEIRARVDKAVNVNEICDVGPFGVVALQAAYTLEGLEWLTELNVQIAANYAYLTDFFHSRLPQFPVYRLEGTYLAWVNIKALNIPAPEVEKSLIEVEKVKVSNGVMYGQEGFLRINMACPPALLEDGLGRIARGLERLMK